MTALNKAPEMYIIKCWLKNYKSLVSITKIIICLKKFHSNKKFQVNNVMHTSLVSKVQTIVSTHFQAFYNLGGMYTFWNFLFIHCSFNDS
jgi:hypothetical protein